MNMVTTFNRGDLISFGKYLLSQERKQSFIDNPHFLGGNALEYRLAEIHHADIENWMESKSLKDKPNRKVKIGDIVVYFPSPDQEYDKYTRNNQHEPFNPVPAMVTAIWSEECVNLTVFPDAPFEPHKEGAASCPVAISVTSCTKLPKGTHNPQTGMWDFR